MGAGGKPLGKFAKRLVSFIRTNNLRIVISDWVLKDLLTMYSSESITELLKAFQDIIEIILVTDEQLKEARFVSNNRNLPRGDVIHCIIARDAKLILVTRDKHFNFLKDISESFKPEDIT